MPLWGSNGSADADKPKYMSHTSVNGAKMGDHTGDVMPTTEGWVVEVQGTGPVVSVSIVSAGTGYANGEALVFSTFGVTPTANAAGTIKTNGAGAITSVTLTSGGAGYNGDGQTSVDVNTVAGTGAELDLVMGGRADRYTTEILVSSSTVSLPTH